MTVYKQGFTESKISREGTRWSCCDLGAFVGLCTGEIRDTLMPGVFY